MTWICKQSLTPKPFCHDQIFQVQRLWCDSDAGGRAIIGGGGGCLSSTGIMGSLSAPPSHPPRWRSLTPALLFRRSPWRHRDKLPIEWWEARGADEASAWRPHSEIEPEQGGGGAPSADGLEAIRESDATHRISETPA